MSGKDSIKKAERLLEKYARDRANVSVHKPGLIQALVDEAKRLRKQNKKLRVENKKLNEPKNFVCRGCCVTCPCQCICE